ncbi:MAG: AAA family ATPase [Spirochaetaceae bacterium]|nr:AAA family ATPase [Spirochaetaceae bacterium]
MNLFTAAGSHQPLAHRLRPQNLDEFIGQEAIVGEGRLLRRAIKADQLSNLIFYGPPGSGKTTLAQIIAATTKSKFISLNAVLAGVKELRAAIDEATQQSQLYSRKTILFIDEVHRWNKSQQDALLPHTENGTIILIGATTENPFFEVNRALVSRSRIFRLKHLTDDDLLKAAHFALSNKERGYGHYVINFEDGALEHLVKVAAGDCRLFYNALELAVETTPNSFPPPAGDVITITLQVAEESIQKKALLYDKDGDYHFDNISAFIKSIRGSDPDAVLYWLARMVASGEDIDYLWRRMYISASEDIGLANPQAAGIVVSLAESYHRLGLPEGQFALAQAALYLATSAKSNSVLAYFDALKAVEEEKTAEVPGHLRDNSRDSELGDGKGYKYPHAYHGHWVAQDYLPAGLKGRLFYRPSEEGYEATIKEQVLARRELQLAIINDDEAEILSFTPAALSKQTSGWLKRSEEQQGENLNYLRAKIFESLKPQRHSTLLIAGDKSGFLINEALRQCPEGKITALAANQSEQEQLSWNYVGLPPLNQPELALTLPPQQTYDLALIYLPKDLEIIKQAAKVSLSGLVLLAGVGTLLSRLLPANLAAKFAAAEALLYANRQESYYEKYFNNLKLNFILNKLELNEELTLTNHLVEKWFKEGSPLAEALKTAGLSNDEFTVTKELLVNKTVHWQRLFYTVLFKE